MRVLGIDPGTAVTGYGVVEPANGRPGRLIECGIIRTNTREKMWQRLDSLWRGNRQRAQLARIDLLRDVGVGSQQRGYMLAQERVHRGRRTGIWNVGETNIRGALNGLYRKMLIARRADAGHRDIARP